MGSATFGPQAPPSGADHEREAGQRLADALDNGGWLRPIAVADAPLKPGEEAYADLPAHGWRYCAIDVQYEHRTVMFGGPFVFAATGLASLLANRRRRQEAERLAAPQWRPLGPLRVVVTSCRLLVLHQRVWYSVWYSAIDDVRTDWRSRSIDVTFAADPPYRISCAGASCLFAVLQSMTPVCVGRSHLSC